MSLTTRSSLAASPLLVALAGVVAAGASDVAARDLRAPLIIHGTVSNATAHAAAAAAIHRPVICRCASSMISKSYRTCVLR